MRIYVIISAKNVFVKFAHIKLSKKKKKLIKNRREYLQRDMITFCVIKTSIFRC